MTLIELLAFGILGSILGALVGMFIGLVGGNIGSVSYQGEWTGFAVGVLGPALVSVASAIVKRCRGRFRRASSPNGDGPK